MPWQLSALVYILLSSSRAIQNRRLGLYKKDLSVYALAASFVSVFLVGLIYSVFKWSSVNHQLALDAWGYIVLGGSLFGMLNLLILRLYRFVPASVGVFMSLLNTISVVIVAGIFTNESMTQRQILGSIVLLSAVIGVGLVASQKSNTSNKSKQKLLIGLMLSLAAALLFGPGIVNENYLIKRIGLETYLLYGWGLQAAWALVISAFFYSRQSKGEKLIKITNRMHVDVWIYGALLGFAGMFFVQSLNDSGNASVVAVSGTARIAVTIILAYLILRERSHTMVKFAGLLLSGLGLTLLFA